MVKKILGPTNRVTIETLNGYLTDGSMSMSPSTETTATSGVPNITRELIEEFAKDEDLKTEEVHYIPHIKKLQAH